MLLHWFHTGPLPANAIHGEYQYSLLVLSFLVASIAVYVALTFIGRLRAERNQDARNYWILGGSFTLGTGIWSAQLLDLLAMKMPAPFETNFDVRWIIGSFIAAMIAATSTFYVLHKPVRMAFQFYCGGFFIALNLVLMNYLGMTSLSTNMNIHYLPLPFLYSIVIAVLTTELGIWLALKSTQGSPLQQRLLKGFVALLLGTASFGMHTMGMTAAIFTPGKLDALTFFSETTLAEYAAFLLIGFNGLIITLALSVSKYYLKRLNAIHIEQDFLKAMFDNIHDGIIACDATGRITLMNQSLMNRLGIQQQNMTLNELQRQLALSTLEHIRLSEDRFPLTMALHGEHFRGMSLINITPEGHINDILVDGQPILNKRGRAIGAVMVIHDITELKKTERLKHAFISTVSHELRTPLTSIRGALELIHSQQLGALSDKIAQLVQIATTNCTRLLSLINDLLDFEKISAGKMRYQFKCCELNQIIEDSIAMNQPYADKFGISLQLNATSSSVMVSVDPDRLIQVMTNLLSNACKFSPKNSTVVIAIEPQPQSVRVSVADTGPGIPEAFKPHLFQLFTQADTSTTSGKGGTGLGLNISKSIVEAHNGCFGYTSELQKGSTFYFELPIDPGVSVLEPIRTSHVEQTT